MRRQVLLCAPVLLLGLCWPSPALFAISAEEVIKQAVARAQAGQESASDYLYTKRAITETLDGRGRVKERKEKAYLVLAGKAYLREMKIDGQPVNPAELKQEDRRTREVRQEMTGSKSSQRDEYWGRFLTEDLTSKYTFTLLGTESINGRAAYVLAFEPQDENLPVRNMADRVLNHLTGKLWIDEQEFAVAKAHVRLEAPATLGGLLKVLGALKHLNYTVERVRVAENVWFNRATRGQFESRKLFDTTSIRTTTESTGFQKNQAARAE